MTIIDRLFALKDERYQQFQSSLIPTIDPETIIGVRVPIIRKLAKELKGSDEAEVFLNQLPHQYYEEYLLHSYIICLNKDFPTCIYQVNSLLPYVDNWAVCDTMSPKAFAANPQLLLPHIADWISSDHTYTIRFGIKMLMDHFLGDLFTTDHLRMVASLRSDKYYVNMMVAWYFATALAKQYDSVIPWLEQQRLDDWTHNKAIQKAVESRRITEEQKLYLKSLKIKKPAG